MLHRIELPKKLTLLYQVKIKTSTPVFQFVAKLKSLPHSKDKKVQLLQDIAHESGFEWNSKALEQKLYKPPAVEEVIFLHILLFFLNHKLLGLMLGPLNGIKLKLSGNCSFVH